MKDPLDKEETPYDVLSVDMNASPREIDLAFQQSLRNRVIPQDAMDARETLLNINERLAIDFYFYQFDNRSLLADEVAGEVDIERLLPVPQFDIDSMTDLSKNDFSADLQEIRFRSLSFSDVGQFSEADINQLPVVFDR